MRLRILRAADEIGGNCVQLESQGKSIFVDLGLPLVAPAASPAFLPPIAGLAEGTNPELLGIVLSHPHQDHYGLLACVHPSVPVHLGDGAKRLLDAASFFVPTAAIKQPITPYFSSRRFAVGPFSVTPLLVDHSAYDAHALVIEADGRKVLYSGDFRMHGRKSRQMEALLRHPPPDVDVLLMEGTTLGRDSESEVVSEDALERTIAASLKDTEGIALAYFSSQNIDRLVTFYRAAVQSGRCLIIDVYTACILEALGRKTLPSPKSPNVRVFLPTRQRRQIIAGKQYESLRRISQRRIYPEEIAADPSKWVMLFRESMTRDLEQMSCCRGGRLMYSLWPGYLDRGSHDLRAWASTQGLGFEIHHTSGHAGIADLRRFVEGIRPRTLVPMHTLYPGHYSDLFGSATVLSNQEWLVVWRDDPLRAMRNRPGQARPQ